MTLLSVIIPTYNSQHKISRCLQSLCQQTFKDFEICIIDGLSSDKTIDLIQEFADSFPNIRIVREPDQGAYDAMNKGIELAEGNWLYFLGSDDELADQDVFADVFQADFSRYGMIYGDVHVWGDTSWAESGRIYDGKFNLLKLFKRNICHQAIFYKKDLFLRYGKYKIHYHICADWEINLRFFPKTSSKYINRVISNFYSGGLSTKNNADSIVDDLRKLKSKALMEYSLYRVLSLFWRFP
jgi:glycosyltransferase involved in cell wall biosynthesis